MTEPVLSEEQINRLCDAIAQDRTVSVAIFECIRQVFTSHRAVVARVKELAGYEQHHKATQRALGLSGYESKPHACYVDDLKQHLTNAQDETFKAMTRVRVLETIIQHTLQPFVTAVRDGRQRRLEFYQKWAESILDELKALTSRV